MGVCRNYRLRHSPLFFVWPFLSIMSKTAIQYLRSKAMSKTLPPPSDDTKVRYAKGRWRELALFGGNWRYLAGMNARMKPVLASIYVVCILEWLWKGASSGDPKQLRLSECASVATLTVFCGYLNGLQWLSQRCSVATLTAFSSYLNAFNAHLEHNCWQRMTCDNRWWQMMTDR